MKIQIQPYLFYQGNCAEAFTFYQSVLGGELQLMRYSDAPPVPEGQEECGGPMKPDFEDKIMHASLKLGDALLMASDDCMSTEPISGVSISLALESEEEVRRVFDALAAGGKIDMPPGPTFWSPLFGMTKDRFGVSWMISVAECALDSEN